MPLLGGQVSVGAVTVTKPVIALEMLKNGKLNILTSKIENLTAGKKKDSGSTPPVTLEKIRVQDGTFSYYDHKTAQDTVVENINADIKAETLAGPFEAKGSFFHEGYALNFEIDSGVYDSKNNILSPKIKAKLQPHNIVIDYAGVVSFSDGFSMQGQTTARIENPEKIIKQYNINGIKGAVQGKGLLTADAKRIDYKDFDLQLGQDHLKGSLRIDLTPLKYSMMLKTTDSVDLKTLSGGAIPFRKTIFDMRITGDQKNMTLHKSSMTLDGQEIGVSGQYGQNKKTKRSEIKIDINAPNISTLAQSFEVDTNAWPKDLKKARIKANLSGDKNSMDMITNISAMDAEIIASGKLHTPFEKPALKDLTVQIKHKNTAQALQIMTGAPIRDKNLQKPLDFYTKLNQSGQRYSLTKVKGNISGMSVEGALDIDMGKTIPHISGDLTFGTLNLNSVMTQNKTSGPRWSKTPIETGGFHAVNMDLSLKAHKIDYGAWPLIKPSLKVKLENGILQISDLKAGVSGGHISLSSTVQTVKKPRQPVHFESNVKFAGVDIGQLSKSLIGAQLVKISGKSNLDMTLKSAGASPAALVHGLSGKGALTGKDIVLDGVDVKRFARAVSYDSKPGDTLLGLWKSTSKGGQNIFDTLDGAFSITDGVVRVDKMALDNSESRIETRGTIHLPNWTQDLTHRITLKGQDGAPPEAEPFEISSSGRLDKPTISFGQSMLQNYLERKAKRKINKILSDKLNIPSNDNNTAPEGTKKTPNIEDVAEEALKGVLDGLLR